MCAGVATRCNGEGLERIDRSACNEIRPAVTRTALCQLLVHSMNVSKASRAIRPLNWENLC